MRTTIRLDDDLYRRVKSHAAMAGTSVTSVIEDALRRLLDSQVVRVPATALPTIGSGGMRPDVPSLDDAAALRDFLDDGLAVDSRR